MSTRPGSRRAIAKPAPTRNAVWKPSVSATGSALPARDRVAVRAVGDRGEDRQAERAADLLATC